MTGGKFKRAGVVLLVACVLVGTLVPGITSADPSTNPEHVSDANPLTVDATATDRAANNTTTRHVNPERVNEDGDLTDVQLRLARELAGRLSNSTIQLSEGQYEAAREVIDGEYSRELGRYVDVAGDTGTEDDERTGDRFEKAQEEQREFTSAVEEYQRTAREYERAKRNENQTRARQLARRLNQLDNRVNETGDNLTRLYRGLSNVTDRDMSDTVTTIQTISRNVTTRQIVIREETFVETTLTARAGSKQISFLDPLVAVGRVTTTNGTPIRNGTVQVAVAGRATRTTTNATGHFTLRYRPVRLSLNATNVTVEYVPENASVYLGAEKRIAVRVEQVRPILKLTRISDRAAFDGNLTAGGTLTVDGIRVRGAPIVLSIDGRRLAGVETAGGGFTVTGRLPADIPPGERQVRVSVPLENRALAPVAANASVSIVETETDLTINAVGPENGVVGVTGRLTTDDGTPVDGQTVEIRVNGTILDTVRTNAAGRYETTVTVPPSIWTESDGKNNPHRALAAFGGEGTNLVGARARMDLVLTGSDGAGGVSGSGVPAWGWVGLGGLLSAIAVGLLVVRQRRSNAEEEQANLAAESGPDATADEPASGGEPDASEALLALARRRVAEGEHDDAVRTGYEALRRELTEIVDPEQGSSGTHWEFYRACQDADLGGGRLDILRDVTEQYERAAFAASAVSDDLAHDVVEDVQEVLGVELPANEEPITGND